MLVLKPLILILIVLQPFVVQSRSIFSKAVKNAINSSFLEKAHTLHVAIETHFNGNEEAFLDEIDNILEGNWNFPLHIDVNNFDGRAVSDHNLWFIDSYQAFLRLLPWISDYHRDSQLFYFIVLRSSNIKEQVNFNVTQRIFSDFLELTVANVHVIVENTSDREVLFYTFFPYQGLHCESPKPIITHRFINDSMKPEGQFFPPKADNFHRCPLRIRTRNEMILNLGKHESENIVVNYAMSILEVVIIKELATRMNFTLEIRNTTLMLDEKEVIVPSASYLHSDRKTELIVGFFWLNDLEEHLLSKSAIYCLSWLVIGLHPRTNKLHTQGYWLFVAFNKTTWIYIIVFFTLIFGCLLVMSRTRRYPRGLELLLFAMGTSMGRLSSRKYSWRLCFMALSLGTMILRAAYQGKLFDAYRVPKMLELPHSIKELFAQNYTIYSHSFQQPILNDLNGEEYPNFREIGKLSEVNLFDDREKLAIVTSFGFIYTFYTEEDRKKLIVEPIIMEVVCMFFKKHSIIQPKINEIIMEMEEAGILPYLRKDFENIKNVGLYVDQKVETEPQALVLEQFVLTFWLWGDFCAISFFVFIGELIWYKFRFYLINSLENIVSQLSHWKYGKA